MKNETKDWIKPCPFCGGEAEFKDMEYKGKYMCAVICKTNGCRADVFSTLYKWENKEDAIKAWNHRPSTFNFYG